MSDEFVVCPMCNKAFKRLTSHIMNAHKMSMNEFKTQYPDTQIVSNGERRKVSLLLSGKNNPFYGKKHSAKTKAKMSKNRRGDENGFVQWAKNPENKKVWHDALMEGLQNKRASQSDEEYTKYCENLSKQAAQRCIDNELLPYGKGHKNGYFTSQRQHIQIYYRSSYEQRFLQICENANEIVFKPCKFYIPYLTPDGTVHNYIPDFILNDTVVIEIKPKSMLNYGANNLKHIAGADYCQRNGLKYIVITEDELRLLECDSLYIWSLLTI